MPAPIRFRSYLAPSLPHALFEHVVEHVRRSSGLDVDLEFETRISGPAADEPEPFARGEIDVGFVCEPSYRWLATLDPAPVLFSMAPTFDDPRTAGQPVYFSDVVVRANSMARGFGDLLDARWTFNDPVSKSGYRVVVDRFASRGREVPSMTRSGSHLASLHLVATGDVDAAAIDSNVLRLALRSEPELATRIRVVESWGPRDPARGDARRTRCIDSPTPSRCIASGARPSDVGLRSIRRDRVNSRHGVSAR